VSLTPVFDEALAAAPEDIWKTSPVFPLPKGYDSLPAYSMEGLSKADVYNAVRANEPIPEAPQAVSA
jgi:hypothetical protein